MRLARSLFYFGGGGLAHIARVLNVPVGRAHRAMNDAYVTAEVLKRMVHDLARSGLLRVGDLLEAQGGAVYAAVPKRVRLPSPFDVALEQRRPLRITYAGPDGPTVRVIEPMYATTRGGVSYLIAYCHLRQDRRTFRMDRIVTARLLDI
jgi:proteasome accessory factor C